MVPEAWKELEGEFRMIRSKYSLYMYEILKEQN